MRLLPIDSFSTYITKGVVMMLGWVLDYMWASASQCQLNTNHYHTMLPETHETSPQTIFKTNQPGRNALSNSVSRETILSTMSCVEVLGAAP